MPFGGWNRFTNTGQPDRQGTINEPLGIRRDVRLPDGVDDIRVATGARLLDCRPGCMGTRFQLKGTDSDTGEALEWLIDSVRRAGRILGFRPCLPAVPEACVAEEALKKLQAIANLASKPLSTAPKSSRDTRAPVWAPDFSDLCLVDVRDYRRRCACL